MHPVSFKKRPAKTRLDAPVHIGEGAVDMSLHCIKAKSGIFLPKPRLLVLVTCIRNVCILKLFHRHMHIMIDIK